MNESDFIALIEQFYMDSFDLERAISLFGPHTSSTPTRIKLSPIDPEIDSVHLEPCGEVVPGEAFVAGAVLRFKQAVRVDFESWKNRFGDFRKLPRVNPWQDVPYQFKITGMDLPGYILLDVPSTAKEQVRPVRRIILRRTPPSGLTNLSLPSGRK